MSHKSRSALRIGVEACLAVLFLIAITSVIDSHELLNITGLRFEFFRNNPNPWIAPAPQPPSARENVDAAIQSKSPAQRILIRPGSTIHKIAADTYGANTVLGMDLIKEFNPHIKNLNWVFSGEDLTLPSLTRDTLLRRQPNGSYRLIAAAFAGRAQADAYARLLASKGYRVIISLNKVADDILLHRVEIDGLKNLQEAIRVWEAGLKDDWLAFVDDPGAGDQLSSADLIY